MRSAAGWVVAVRTRSSCCLPWHLPGAPPGTPLVGEQVKRSVKVVLQKEFGGEAEGGILHDNQGILTDNQAYLAAAVKPSIAEDKFFRSNT